MKTSIKHLPKRKREQLQHVVDAILEVVEAEMIILFGSYARGDWVEELASDGHHYQYQSDFDIYVLVRNRKVANRFNRKQDFRNRLRREIGTRVSLISESVGRFNHCLSQGQYFYTDIKNEGILLYDSGRFKLGEARELSIKERRKKAEEYFDYWFNIANSFLTHFQLAFDQQDYVFSAFLLHQATERFYTTILLVFTDYRPKLHDIDELGKMASSQDPIFLTVFPHTTDEERRKFELLRKAYIDARYNKDFVITRDDLIWLAVRVKKLQRLIGEVCKKKIESFK